MCGEAGGGGRGRGRGEDGAGGVVGGVWEQEVVVVVMLLTEWIASRILSDEQPTTQNDPVII